MNPKLPLRRTLLCSALAVALAACGGSEDATANGQTLAANSPAPKGGMSEAAMIDELASQLQACSYDGAPVTIDSHGLSGSDPGAGQQVVAEIMKYTGLPQNFDVLPHPQVPNAAAVILVGDDKLPHRVIAYNERFMADVQKATANNNWAPVSIMAHEVGHHLSGHTIQPGGSQPPTELEADKFSGYVLYKMGALLADAQKAMNTLVPEADGPTHPGRGKRVTAIAEGWEQACAQQGGDCSGTVASLNAPTRTPAADSVAQNAPADSAPATATATPATTRPADAPAFPTFPTMGGDKPASTTVAAKGPADVLPKPDANAIPAKFGKFVIDEVGLLDTATRAAFEKRMYETAEQHQVEIVTIIAKSLHGMSADDYAYAMMRQLRVGKLDVGNGAVLVAVPGEGQAGVAMGPGVMLEMRDYVDLEKDRLKGFLEIGVPYCKGACNDAQTEMAFGAAEHVAQSVSHWDFQIRYQNLGELMAKFEEISNARMNGTDIEPEQDPTWRKITRIEGKLVSRNPAAGEQSKWINDVHAEMVGAPMHVVTADGRNLLVYAHSHTEGLMTSKLEEGKSYVFITREASLSQNPEDTLSFDVLSYDLAAR
ncbi:MAG: TPM domain-containing protein [Xanthomonadales bacterium]|nr:TPM domain-containing protein [Xanthomonadales bacterium]